MALGLGLLQRQAESVFVLRDELRERNAKRLAPERQFHEVQSANSTLDLADPALVFLQFFGQVDLGHSGLRATLGEQLEKHLVAS